MRRATARLYLEYPCDRGYIVHIVRYSRSMGSGSEMSWNPLPFLFFISSQRTLHSPASAGNLWSATGGASYPWHHVTSELRSDSSSLSKMIIINILESNKKIFNDRRAIRKAGGHVCHSSSIWGGGNIPIDSSQVHQPPPALQISILIFSNKHS
jgi:hypothetical protein